MTSHPIILCSLLVIALTGCSSQSTITAPQLSTPGHFSTTGQAEESNQWWTSFEDAPLNKLMAAALNDNFSLRAAVDRLNQAAAIAGKNSAGSAPSLSMSFDGDRTFQDAGNTNNFKFGVMATYEVDLWSRLAAKEASANFDYLATQEALQTAAITLSSEVASHWYKWVTQESLIQLYTEQVTNLEQQISVLEMRYRYGQSNAEDVMQQQQTLENLKAKKLKAESESELIQQQLALLTGKSSLPPLNIPTLPILKPMPKTGVPATLAARRPDLKQAWYQVESQNQNVIIAEADRLPQISLTASLLSSDQHFSDLLRNWTGNLAAGILAPIFDSGLRQSEIDYQKAVLSESLNTYSQVALKAFTEVETALTREQSELEQLNSINKQLSLATRTETIKKNRYTNGENNFLEYLNAQNSRLTLEQQQLQSKGQLLAERILLHRALAGELPVDVFPTHSVSSEQ